MPRVEDVFVRDARGPVSVAIFEPGESIVAPMVVLGGSSSWALQTSDLPEGYGAWIGISGSDLSSLLPGVSLEAGEARFTVMPRPDGGRTRWAYAESSAGGSVRPGDGAVFPGEAMTAADRVSLRRNSSL